MSLIEYNGESKVIKRICELLDTMSGINFEVVQTLPLVDISTSTIYLVPKQTAEVDNIYDEYINTDGTSQGWELIGTTEIDLSNYYTKTEVDNLIPTDFVPKSTGGTFDGNVNIVKKNTGTSSVDSYLTLGNDKANGTTGCTRGVLEIFGGSAYRTRIFHSTSSRPTTNRIIYLPDKDGTFAITDDIPDELSDLSDDSTHRLVTDTDISSWNGKAETSDIKDGTLTIQLNGENQQTFTANQDSNVTANIKAVDWVSNGKLGAKNLNSYPYYETSHSEANIAWTDNGDGTVTANNTSTGNSSFICHSRISGRKYPLILPNGKYILSGCPSGGSDSSYRLIAYVTKNGSASTLGVDYGEGAVIEVNGDDNYNDKALVQIGCDIRGSGVVCNNLTFKPMIRVAEDSDDTFQPYALTNKQLSDIANSVPTSTGTYTLQATRNSDGTITYAWV